MDAGTIPTALQRYFDKGIQAYTQGSYDYAVDLLTYVIKQVPDATEARRYLRLAVQKQYSQHPPSWLTHLALWVLSLPVLGWSLVYTARGQHRRAIQLDEWLLRLQPRSRVLLMRLATSLSHAGLEDAAQTTYEELLTVYPSHLAALRHLARLTMKRGNDARARQCFERILTLAPNDLEAQQGVRNLDALGTLKKGFTT